MSKPRLLDAFSGAGGAGKGYMNAGFEVVGVDIMPQPHIPYEFIQADALEYIAAHGHEFDVIHSSPPCHKFTGNLSIRLDADERRENHLDLITPLRPLLVASGKPYVIENVVGARKMLHNPIMLCGTMFPDELRVIRHRLFESNVEIQAPGKCDHRGTVNDGTYCGVYGSGGAMWTDEAKTVRRKGSRKAADWREAMGIDWMTKKEIVLSIPPTYTFWLSKYLLDACFNVR